MYKLWLDDIRVAPHGWIAFTCAEDLRIFILSVGWNKIEAISLDHDLGNGVWTGYDFLNWVEKYMVQYPDQHCPEFKIHSANPVGRNNMQRAINSIYRLASADATGHP